jgi:beta-glucosidase
VARARESDAIAIGFERVHIGARASKDVTTAIDPRSLSSVDEEGNRAILSGKYLMSLGGGQPQDTRAKSEAEFTVIGSQNLPK